MNRKVAVFISNNGYNLEALVDSRYLCIEIVLVVTNNKNSGGIKIAQKSNIPVFYLDAVKEKYNEILVEKCLEKHIELVILDDWTQSLTNIFINKYINKIITLQHSLPGKYTGKNSIKKAYNDYLEGKISYTGVMVNLVCDEMDNLLGDEMEVIDWIEVPIYKSDTYEILMDRVTSVGKPLLINSINKYLNSTGIQYNKYNIYIGRIKNKFDIGYDLICLYFSDINNSIGRGHILNLTNKWWLDRTSHIIPNHMVHMDGNYLICKKCRVIPIKIIVLSFMTDSLWEHYKNGVRNYCGINFPDGIDKNKPLPELVITPIIKEDIYKLISKDEILESNILQEKDLFYIYTKSLELFKYGQEVANSRNLILVDTKYEFGKDLNGKIILIDEIHTPDSSRYFYIEGYQEKVKSGLAPKQLSKEFVRQWLIENGFQGKEGQSIPEMSEEYVTSVSERYIELYEHILGEKFVKEDVSNVIERLEKNILSYLSK